MAALDHQLGVANESTYGTLVTPTRFFEYDSESIEVEAGRTEGEPLRVGSRHLRSDRFTPYIRGAGGDVEMAVLTKGFGFWLRHMLGSVATTGPAETTVYTHTGTDGELLGDSFTMQVNKPFHPAGTNQPVTYRGCKITEWELGNNAEENLMLKLGVDAMQQDTVTALATASYPTAMDNLSWAGGVVTIGGSAYDVTEFAVNVNNGLDVDRRQIRGNPDKKEPTAGGAEGTFSLKADFESLTQRNRVYAASRAGALAVISAKWTGPTLLGSTIFPSLEVQIPAGRFDEWSGEESREGGIEQEVGGTIRYDGASSAVTLIYRSADVTA